MIYRGQKYGERIGEWWTSSIEDATSFAMSRGGNRDWVVLGLDEDDELWLLRHEHAIEVGDNKATWYHIPIDNLKKRWMGAQIIKGALAL